METNSVHSNGQAKEKKIEQSPIHESIFDSLDNAAEDKMKMEKMEEMCRASQFGFGQQLMNRFMGDLERPYSPPIG